MFSPDGILISASADPHCEAGLTEAELGLTNCKLGKELVVHTVVADTV